MGLGGVVAVTGIVGVVGRRGGVIKGVGVEVEEGGAAVGIHGVWQTVKFEVFFRLDGCRDG